MIIKLRGVKPQPQWLKNYMIKQVAKSHHFSQKFLYIISMLHNRLYNNPSYSRIVIGSRL